MSLNKFNIEQFCKVVLLHLKLPRFRQIQATSYSISDTALTYIVLLICLEQKVNKGINALITIYHTFFSSNTRDKTLGFYSKIELPCSTYSMKMVAPWSIFHSNTLIILLDCSRFKSL